MIEPTQLGTDSMISDGKSAQAELGRALFEFLEKPELVPAGGHNVVRENLKALHELQTIDSRVLEVERIAAILPGKIREFESGAEKIRNELGSLNSDIETKKREQRDIEGQVKEESEKHKKWKRRLNEIKTPREYQALSREIEMGERQVRDFEESVLGIMSDVENKQKIAVEKDIDLKAREVEVAGKVRELRIRQAELTKEAAKIAEGRVELIKKLPTPLVKKYEQLRERRNGIGIGLVVAGSCQGCNVQLRPQQLIELKKYVEIMACANCYRILVPDELVRVEKKEEG